MKNEKSLKVSEQTWKKLQRWKYEYGYFSIEEIIDKLLSIVPASELKIIKKDKGNIKAKRLTVKKNRGKKEGGNKNAL